MSKAWRIQPEIETLSRLAAKREQQRRDKEEALKQEKGWELIQAEIDREMKLKKILYKKQEEEKVNEERFRVEQIEEEARLKATAKAARLQANKEKEDSRRKKEEGWTENELELLQKLKQLRSPPESEGATMPSISVTNLEDIARLLHQSNIPLGNTNEEIAAF